MHNQIELSAPSGFSHEYATIQHIDEELRIHYVIGGKEDGEPILLIPGWPQTWYVWRNIMPILAKNNYRVIAVDIRGMGESSITKNGYDLGTLAFDLQRMMSQLRYDRYDIVGHDIGVWIGYAMASDYPQSIKKLAVSEGSIPGIADFQPLMMEDKMIPLRWHFLFNRLPGLPEKLLSGKEDVFLRYEFNIMAFRPERVAIDEYIRSYSRPDRLIAGLEIYRAIPEHLRQNEIRSKTMLSLPVLALGGDKSAGLGTVNMMKKVASSVSGTALSQCGHFTPEECPEEFLEHLLPFLKI